MTDVLTLNEQNNIRCGWTQFLKKRPDAETKHPRTILSRAEVNPAQCLGVEGGGVNQLGHIPPSSSNEIPAVAIRD